MKKSLAVSAAAALVLAAGVVPSSALADPVEVPERSAAVVSKPVVAAAGAPLAVSLVPVRVVAAAEVPQVATAAPAAAAEVAPVAAPAVVVPAAVAADSVAPPAPAEVPADGEEEGEPVAFEVPVEVEPAPGDPVVFGPETVYVVASDGALVPESELAFHEEWLAAGNELPVGFEEPVEVEPAAGDPVVFGPETVYVTASDGSLVPASELAGYEEDLANGYQAPIGFEEPLPAE